MGANIGNVRLTVPELPDQKQSKLSRGEVTPFSERGSAVLPGLMRDIWPAHAANSKDFCCGSPRRNACGGIRRRRREGGKGAARGVVFIGRVVASRLIFFLYTWPTTSHPRPAVYFCFGLIANIDGSDADVGSGLPSSVIGSPVECPGYLPHRKSESRTSAPEGRVDRVHGCPDLAV